MAEVVVSRGTACGSNCGNCESCVFQNEIKTVAKNSVHARQGEKVVIETRSSRIYGAAFLVYIVPLAVFILGYAVAALLGAAEGTCILCSFLAMCVAVAIIVVTQRHSKNKNPIKFEIIKIRNEA